MHDLVPGFLLVFNGVFVFSAYLLNGRRGRIARTSFFGAFAVFNAVAITYGAETGVLFDGRATSDQWLINLFLPVLLFFLAFSICLAAISRVLGRSLRSYFAFTLLFALMGFFALFASLTILVALVL